MWFLYSKFKARKWLKYSYEKRFKIFVELEKRVAKKLKIEPILCTKFELDELANGNHQGIIVDIEEFDYCDIDDIIKEQGLIQVWCIKLVHFLIFL